jgi:hypothetical protein
MLMHGFYDQFPGVHGWSTDPLGLTGWEFSRTAAYSFDAYLDQKRDGKSAVQSVRLGKRERPQVVLRNGQLAYLYNGARGPAGSPQWTFNMATEICQHGPSNGGVCPPAPQGADWGQ